MRRSAMWKCTAAALGATMLMTGCSGTNGTSGAAKSTDPTAQESTVAPAGEGDTEGSVAGAGESVPASAGAQTVTVTATGTVPTTPDVATISFDIESQASKATDAQEKNSALVSKVTDELSKLGVKDNDITTSNYSMYPRYDNYGNKVTGYQVTTTLTVDGQKIKDAGSIIDACVNAGATGVNQVTYTCSNYDEAYDEALKKATQAAGEKAKTLAEASRKNLGGIVSATEGYEDRSYASTDSGFTMATAASEKSSMQDSVNLMPGQLDIEAQVTVTYAWGN